MGDFYVNIVVDSDGNIKKVFRDLSDAQDFQRSENGLFIRVFKVL